MSRRWSTIQRINKRGALIKVLDKPHLDLTTPIGGGFIAFLSALAEDERQRIVKRANDGRKAARARGARFGRKPKLDTHQQAEALKRLLAGESARARGSTRRRGCRSCTKDSGRKTGSRPDRTKQSRPLAAAPAS